MEAWGRALYHLYSNGSKKMGRWSPLFVRDCDFRTHWAAFFCVTRLWWWFDFTRVRFIFYAFPLIGCRHLYCFVLILCVQGLVFKIWFIAIFWKRTTSNFSFLFTCWRCLSFVLHDRELAKCWWRIRIILPFSPPRLLSFWVVRLYPCLRELSSRTRIFVRGHDIRTVFSFFKYVFAPYIIWTLNHDIMENEIFPIRMLSNSNNLLFPFTSKKLQCINLEMQCHQCNKSYNCNYYLQQPWHIVSLLLWAILYWSEPNHGSRSSMGYFRSQSCQSLRYLWKWIIVANVVRRKWRSVDPSSHGGLGSTSEWWAVLNIGDYSHQSGHIGTNWGGFGG